MTRLLSGKTALVTGGSRGIGRAICLSLAQNGANVFVNYSSGAGAAEETVTLCKEQGVNSWALGFNVADAESVGAAFKQMKELSPTLDILVNNAGIVIDGIFIRYKAEDWDKVLKVNLYGSFNCSQEAAKVMMKQRSGTIINISSVVGEMGNAGQAAYVSSKAGLIGLTKSLARELSARNITVNAITPGFIETEMTEKLDERVKQEHLKIIPLSKYGSVEDIAGTVSFLASPHAGYITGQIIGVNGGMYM